MIVFSEFSPSLPPSSSTTDLRKATEATKLTGCEVYFIPQDFEQFSGVSQTPLLPLWSKLCRSALGDL